MPGFVAGRVALWARGGACFCRVATVAAAVATHASRRGACHRRAAVVPAIGSLAASPAALPARSSTEANEARALVGMEEESTTAAQPSLQQLLPPPLVCLVLTASCDGAAMKILRLSHSH